ncbi:hypothetical protein EP837_03046 [Sphingobium sp. EP60837]|nr:hypothetical protein EP837_03046 [Sphingobium sp. EP60837]
MTIGDVNGAARTVTQSFYTSPRLLREGLDAFSLEADFCARISARRKTKAHRHDTARTVAACLCMRPDTAWMRASLVISRWLTSQKLRVISTSSPSNLTKPG